MLKYVALAMVFGNWAIVFGCGGERRTLAEIMMEVEVGDDIQTLGERVEDQVEDAPIVDISRASEEGRAWLEHQVELPSDVRSSDRWLFGRPEAGGISIHPKPTGAWVVCHLDDEIVHEPVRPIPHGIA